MALDVARHQEGLPAAAPAGRRSPPRVPRFRVLVTEAAGRARRDGRGPIRTYFANVQPQRVQDRRRVDRALRGSTRQIATFINSPSPSNVVFGKNVTEAITLVAYSWGRANLREGDAVVLTEMEHHANIVPWLILQEERGIELRWLGITDDYQLDLSDLDEKLDGAKSPGVHRALERPRHDHAGPPARGRRARRRRAVPRGRPRSTCRTSPPTCKPWAGDFFGFTGHKMCGPTGVGVLWAREEILDAIAAVHGRRRDDPRRPQGRLDAEGDPPGSSKPGRLPIVEVIGLGAAVDYLNTVGWRTSAATSSSSRPTRCGR